VSGLGGLGPVNGRACDKAGVLRGCECTIGVGGHTGIRTEGQGQVDGRCERDLSGIG
jgi:hypothetical protein